VAKGIIKFFNESRGYGFIESALAAETDGRDLFVHYTQIADDGYRTLKEGQEVTFDVREGRRGLEAINVHQVS